jgi:hypothetical protein
LEDLIQGINSLAMKNLKFVKDPKLQTEAQFDFV